MIKDKKEKQYFYNNNFTHKNLNPRINSPIVSHQENNYYYNTKINHLIFQELSDNKNEFEQLNIPSNSMYLNDEYSESNLNQYNKINSINLGRINYKNSTSLSKLEKIKNMKKNLNETDFNNYDPNQKDLRVYGLNSIIYRNNNSPKLNSKNILQGSITSNNNLFYNNSKTTKNKESPFIGFNKLKKNNIKMNDMEIMKMYNNQNIKNYKITSPKNNYQANNGLNNNTYIDLMAYKNINNNYFYNIQNNYEENATKQVPKSIKGKNSKFLSNYSSINSIKNKKNNCKKIPLKNEKIGNYHIKNPCSKIEEKDRIKNYKTNKSPQILSIKHNFNSGKYSGSNKFSNNGINNNKEIYNYKKLINVNVNNEKNQLNNNENINKKKYFTNNINLYKSNPQKITTNDIKKNIKKYNQNNKKEEILNNLNQSNNNIINRPIEQNNQNITYYYNQINDTKKINRKTNYNLSSISKFCDILEQYYYISFKKCFQYFLQKINLYNEKKYTSTKAVILRRMEGLKKPKKSNNNNFNNNSFTNTNELDNQKEKENFIDDKDIQIKEINNKGKTSKSPSKFLELQNNIMPSMMKINQDNYIQMFNELFMQKRENSSDKKCRSPIIEKITLKESFDIFNNNDKDNTIYEKYGTNTNKDMIYLRKGRNYKSKGKNEGVDRKNNNKINDINVIFKNSNFKTNLNKRYTYKADMNNQGDSINTEINNKIYKISTEKNDFYGNIFNEEKINPRKDNYSIDIDFNINNFNQKILNGSDKIYFNKNMLLYSKPLLSKSISKKGVAITNRNNLDIIYLKKSEKNFLNYSMNNVNSSPNKVISLCPTSPINQNKPSKFNMNKSGEIKKKESRKNEIIVKNVHTDDKKLNVFIKYVKLQNYQKNKKFKSELSYTHTDSISLICKIDNLEKINVLKNNYSTERNNRIKINYQEKKTEETINNNSFSYEEDNKVTYLFNFLQNMFNDNKKTILYNFFKKLKKIKTNYLLQNSMKSKGKYRSKRYNQNQNGDNNNIIELTKYKNNNNLSKNNQLINIRRNVDGKNKYDNNLIKSEDNLEEINFKNIDKNNINNSTEKNSISYNKSYNNIFENSEKDKKEENKKKKNELKGQEQLKKIKLAKLGKLFKNLEQENNIINTIKEQFLDWTNKQTLNINQDKNKEENQTNKRKYGLRTYNTDNAFNNELSFNNKENLELKFKHKLNEFRNKLIHFFLTKNK